MLQDVYDEFELELKSTNKSAQTIETYRSDFRQLMKFLAAENVQPTLEALNPRLIRQYMRWMQKRGLSPATRQRRFNSLRSFFRFCLAEELLETNPMKHIDPPKVAKNTLPVYMDDAEMRTVLQRVKNARHYFAKRDRALILTLLLAGLRRSEIIRLNWEDVDLKTIFC